MSLPAQASVFPAELEALLRLYRLPEMGPKRFQVLLDFFDSASRAISASASAWGALGLPPVLAEARRHAEVWDDASHALA